MIKRINHRKRQDRHAELQASISPSIFNQILISTPPWMRNLKRKRKESRKTSGSVSTQVNLIEIQLECIHRRRTLRFIGKRGVTVRSVRYSLINGPDTCVTANRYDLISALQSLNGRSGFDLHDLRYKTHKKRRPSDRDPTIVMRFGAFNRGRYNSS